jgi:hypothetical protein
LSGIRGELRPHDGEGDAKRRHHAEIGTRHQPKRPKPKPPPPVTPLAPSSPRHPLLDMPVVRGVHLAGKHTRFLCIHRTHGSALSFELPSVQLLFLENAG